MLYYGLRLLEPIWFGVALVVLLVGDIDFKIVDGFVMGLWTGFTLVFVNVNGLGVGQGRWENRWIRIVFAAFEILRHMLDFRSSASCLGFG